MGGVTAPATSTDLSDFDVDLRQAIRDEGERLRQHMTMLMERQHHQLQMLIDRLSAVRSHFTDS